VVLTIGLFFSAKDKAACDTLILAIIGDLATQFMG